MSRPRPVELAVAFDDGTAVTTLVNPQRDLADARKAFGISVSDVLLAPTLREAWAVIAPMLAGCTPVGVGVDETLGLIDFELKRLGHVTAMPLGVELRGRPGCRVGRHWSGRSRRWRRMAGRIRRTGRRRSRNLNRRSRFRVCWSAGIIRCATPTADHLPGLSALLRVSRDVGAVVLGGAAASTFDDAPDTPWDAAARQSVADQLRAAAGRAQLPAEVVARVGEASKLLGVEIVSESVCLECDDIGEVLAPGTRICFTGTAQDGAGRIVERWEMEQLAVSAGLTPVQSVSKTRCEVLVTAEAGSAVWERRARRRSTASRCSPQASS